MQEIIVPIQTKEPPQNSKLFSLFSIGKMETHFAWLTNSSSSVSCFQNIFEVINKYCNTNRKIIPKKFKDCVSKNLVETFGTTNDRSFQIPTNYGSEQYEYSFFIKTITEWNGLASHIVTAKSLDSFKTQLLFVLKDILI